MTSSPVSGGVSYCGKVAAVFKPVKCSCLPSPLRPALELLCLRVLADVLFRFVELGLHRLLRLIKHRTGLFGNAHLVRAVIAEQRRRSKRSAPSRAIITASLTLSSVSVVLSTTLSNASLILSAPLRTQETRFDHPRPRLLSSQETPGQARTLRSP